MNPRGCGRFAPPRALASSGISVRLSGDFAHLEVREDFAARIKATAASAIRGERGDYAKSGRLR